MQEIFYDQVSLKKICLRLCGRVATDRPCSSHIKLRQGALLRALWQNSVCISYPLYYTGRLWEYTGYLAYLAVLCSGNVGEAFSRGAQCKSTWS
jgi:hypothetical protein